MPRYAGQPQNLKHRIELSLDDERLVRSKACADRLNVPRAEAIRRGIDLLYLTLFSSNPIDSTMQSNEQAQQ